MGWFGRKHKLNKKGMSLVEVIVAVTILTIVATPLLQMLTSSARYNMKARVRQRGITAAESIFESFKAYDLDALCRQFDATPGTAASFQGVVLDGTSTLNVNAVYSDGTSGIPVRKANGELEVADSYLFTIQNALLERNRYDAYISVTKGATGTPLDSGVSILELETMDATQNAVYIADAEVDSTVIRLIAEEFAEEINSHCNFGPEDVTYKANRIQTNAISITERTTTIYVEDQNKVSYSLSYAYTVRGNYQYLDERAVTHTVSEWGGGDYSSVLEYPFGEAEVEVVVDGTPTTQIVKVTQKELYDSAVTGNPVKAIYMFYYPMYAESVTAELMDHIVIKPVGSCGNLDFYVIKQKSLYINTSDPASANTAKMITREDNYVGRFDVVQDGAANITLHHNLNMNIYSNMPNGVTDDNLSKFKNFSGVQSLYNIYTNTTGQPGYDSRHSASWKWVGYNTESDKKYLNYDVMIEIYEAGKVRGVDEPVAILEGSVVE